MTDNKQRLENIRDKLAIEWFGDRPTHDEVCAQGFRDGWDSAMERAKILEEALEEIAVAKGADEYYGEVLGGFLMNKAREALAKFYAE